ncbi:MAG: glycosyltransferase family 4 protein [Alphaproteobacteria bacterium]|nr:glycosyltransferase family 4 protein [Alphaproteobacteria bacterium]
MQRPRLLFVLADAPFFVTHRLSLAVAAKVRGFEVHVALPVEPAPLAVMIEHGLVVHDLPLERGGQSLWRELRLIVALARLMRALRPRLVHLVSLKPVIFGGLVARLSGVPAALAVTGLGHLFLRHGLGTMVTRSVVKRLYRFALHNPRSRAIFQNPDDLVLFSAAGLVPLARAVLIKGTGVDTARFAPEPEPPGVPVVMFPARVLGDKGVNEFVGAARLLRATGVAARFVLVGRTDPHNPTDVGEAGIRRWESEGVVEWWGFQTDMPAMLNRAAIVCLPSYMEGLPRVLIEAAACGRPIVTAAVPGCREIVRDGENGLLVPARDAAATAAALGSLIADPALRRRFGARGRAIALAEYTEARVTAATLAVYDAVLAEAASA